MSLFSYNIGSSADLQMLVECKMINQIKIKIEYSFQVNMRLKWVLENNEMVKHLANEGHVMFGTIDTWLVYRLTEAKVRHLTIYDYFPVKESYDNNSSMLKNELQDQHLFQVFATDYSNASGTALYDPYLEDWNSFFLKLFGMPKSLFPELKNSVGDWGICSPKYFGVPIPITAVVRSLVVPPLRHE